MSRLLRGLVGVCLALPIALALVAAGPPPDDPDPPAPPASHAEDAGADGFQNCARCHTTAGWKVLRDRVRYDHSRTGFPLLGRHAAAACSACHGARLVFEATPGACDTCHFDRHRGALGRSCDRCHDERGWEPRATVQQHRETRFPLAGAHAVADCTACHVRARAGTYRATSTACLACHAADRLRPGLHPNHLTGAFRGECDTCHNQYSWFPAQIRHDLYWPLRGAHQAADCFACHAGGRYGGTSRDCYTCHRDEYAAVADPPHLAHGYSPRCNRCHTDLEWVPARTRWHDTFYRISSGPHAQFGCVDCHPAGQPPQVFTCIACHTKAAMDREHDDESGYHWENFACYACHARGGGD